jgi:hypothetical protein
VCINWFNVCIDSIIVLFNLNDARINIINAWINAIDVRIKNIARINWYEDIFSYFTMLMYRELTCAFFWFFWTTAQDAIIYN